MIMSGQKGFSAVEGLLVIVIAGIVGFTGWFVWHSQQSTNKLDTQTLSDSKPPQPSAKKVNSYEDCIKAAGSIMQETYPQVCVTKDGKHFTQPVAQAKHSINYLTLKEWGVKIPLSSNISDAEYRIGSVMDPLNIFFSTKVLSGTNCDLHKGSVGYYIRFKAGETDSETKRSYSSEYPDAVNLGSYYYGFGVNPADVQCSKDTNIQKIAVTARNELKSALKGIQTVKQQ